MFSQARFRWALVDLVNNPGMPIEWDPYGVPVEELLLRAIALEAGSFRNLPPRQRAIAAALAMIETELMPSTGKETLFLTSREYAHRHNERVSTSDFFERAERHMKATGLLDTKNSDARINETAEKLARAIFDDVVSERRNFS